MPVSLGYLPSSVVNSIDLAVGFPLFGMHHPRSYGANRGVDARGADG
jgi:hypothetical protein